MKRDKEWAQKEVDRYLSYEGVDEARNALIFAKGVINQLDEPEVTLDRAFEKVAESYPMTKEEVWRHLELLEAYGGKVIYGEPEILSKEWIDNNSINASHDGVTDEYVHVDDLKNLLVPKQAWLEGGYEVEKEKRYRVIIPTKDKLWKYYYLDDDGGINMVDNLESVESHTEEFIRSVSDDLWQFAVEVAE